MKMKLFFILLILYLISHYAFSQTYRGVVYDENDTPLPYTNVVLITKDSVMVSGTTTNTNGNFDIYSDNQNVYYVKISFIGYRTVYKKADSGEKIIVKLDVDSNLLSDVVVSAHKKIYNIEGGVITANVKDTYLTNIASTHNLISELPLISEQNGQLTVFGKGSPLIFINGKQIRSKNELDRISPKDIDKIDLITTPGAEYDATVGAIIKITTLRKEEDGISINLVLKQGKGKYFLGEEQFSMDYVKGNFDIYGSIGFNHEKSHSLGNTNQEFNINNLKHYYGYETTTIPKSQVLSPDIGFNYITDKNSFGAKYLGTFESGATNVINIISSTMGESETIINQIRNTKISKQYHRLNAYYNSNLSEKVSLFITSDYAQGNIDNDDAIQINNEIENQLLTEGNSNYSLFYFKTSINNQINRGIVTIGGEYSNTINYQSYDINDPIGTQLDNSSNHSIQNRIGLFVNYRNSFKNFSYNIGIRYENINMRYIINEVLDKESSVLYNKIFPNLMISYRKKESKFASTLSYEKKVRYPTYYEMRSNIQYDSPFLYESGNPNLNPSMINNITSVIVYKKIQSIISYNKFSGLIIRNIMPYKDASILIFKPVNIQKSSQLNILLAFEPQIKFWRPRLETGMIRQWLKVGDPVMQYDKPIYLVGLRNTLNFRNNLLFRLNMQYRTSGHYETVLGDHTGFVNMAVSKSFLNNNLLFEFSLDDIFNTRRERFWLAENNINMYSKKKIDSRKFFLTITYRFNNFKKSKLVDTIDELNRLK